MSLVEKLKTPPPPPHVKSRIDHWIETLPTPEREAVLAAAVNPGWGHTVLQKELVAAGAPKLSETAFRQWRNKVGYGA